MDGQAHRLCNSKWVPLGGGAKLDSVGVGVDGYVLGVDLDGDLFGCQLQSTVAIPRRVSSRDCNAKLYIVLTRGLMRQERDLYYHGHDDLLYRSSCSLAYRNIIQCACYIG